MIDELPHDHRIGERDWLEDSFAFLLITITGVLRTGLQVKTTAVATSEPCVVQPDQPPGRV
jgi:hypothetical protein